MRIENAVVLVTGANRGLGKSLVNALLKAGVKRIYAGARAPDAIQAEDARVVPVRLDVTISEDVAALGRLGDITVAINNAGLLGSYGVLHATRAEIERDFATNFYGPLAVTKAVLPSLERSHGALVNILTVASFAGLPALGGYAASKSASFSLTQSLRSELRGRGVTVHAVFPGAIDTDMIKAMTIAKTSPDEMAQTIVEGLIAGDENIAPDVMSRQLFALWERDPKAVEREFAQMAT